MMRWESGTVVSSLDAWPGVVRVRVRVDVPGDAPDGSAEVRAIAYSHLTGVPELGERVLLNTNALRRGLGTGGDALVVARPDALVAPAALVEGESAADAPHMMKARYTPGQVMVDAIDDPSSEHRATMLAAHDLEGMPVVAADLHSALPAIVAGIRATAPHARIAYVLTDGAALPAWYSRTVASLRAARLLACCLSAGQAFGGDLEAVSIPSALLGARHVVGADVAIAIQGPGNLGTGTAWGFSGVQAADALNAAGALGGAPVAALRVSGADPRDRHRGLSHHSATAYGRLVHVPCTLPLWPATESGEIPVRVREQVERQILDEAATRGLVHVMREVEPADLLDALRALPVRLSTMGRGLDEDPSAFLASALAGRAAAELIPGR